MTVVKLLTDSKRLCGFDISGHSSENCKDSAGKIVCAAVSSAAYLTANTVTDVIRADADVTVSDARMLFILRNPGESESIALRGFELHITQLSAQYPHNIKVVYSEVNYVKD